MTNKNETAKNAMIHLFSTYSSVNSGDDEIDEAANVGMKIDADKEMVSNQLDMTTEGLIRLRGNRIEIEYFETELTGMEGSCTCISFERDNPGIVSMIRTGSVTTALIFEEDKRHICAYNTDFTAFEICVKATEVKNNMTEDGGEIILDYGVEFRGAATEHTYVKIAVSPTGT